MISTHSINTATCTNCELCVAICPAGIVIKEETGGMGFRNDRMDICVRCGHCMAMCASKSIQIEGISYEANFREIPPLTVDHSLLMDFLMSRRSVRVFKNKPVPEEMVRKIIEVISTAPFGVSPDNVSITAVTDPALIQKAVPYMSKTYMQLGKILKVPFLGWLIRRSVPKETRNTLVNFIVPHLSKGLYDTTGGIDDIARNAPAMLLFHAPKGAEEHTVDSHIYITYAMLAAHSLGLGSTIIGLIGPAVNQSKPLREMFRIPPGNEVVEAMILGYPKFPFKHAIVRPRRNVTFVE